MQIQHLLIPFVILFLALGCSPQSKIAENGPYKVRLLWEDEQKGLIFKVIELFSLNNLKEVHGDAVRFYLHPKVEGGRLSGPGPHARYTISPSGEVIPRDVLSSQLYTVYAHMERLMNFDEKLGVKALNTWPRDIGVAVRYMDSGSPLVNNAMYAPQFDAMLFVPYTDSKLPITLNAGVIAHEHFHSLFYKLAILPFADKQNPKTDLTNHNVPSWMKAFDFADSAEQSGPPENSDRSGRNEESVLTKDEAELYHLYLLKSMNEGLADFWGWVYSQNSNFVADSLSILDDSRELKPQSIRLTTTEVFLRNLNAMTSDSMRASYIYQMGTLYAQIFKNYSIHLMNQKSLSQQDAQFKVAQALVAVLPKIGQQLNVKDTLDLVSTDALLQAFVAQMVSSNGALEKADCEFFEAVQSKKSEITLFEECKK